MRGLAILLLIVVFFWVVWPRLSRWLKRKAMERAEDYVRSSMGMPPRDRGRRSSQKQQDTYTRERRNPFGPDSYTKGPIIPKEYAEDVEFTETIDYSETREDRFAKPGSADAGSASMNSGDNNSKSGKFHRWKSRKSDDTSYQESQISDVEFTEIKRPRGQ